MRPVSYHVYWTADIADPLLAIVFSDREYALAQAALLSETNKLTDIVAVQEDAYGCFQPIGVMVFYRRGNGRVDISRSGCFEE